MLYKFVFLKLMEATSVTKICSHKGKNEYAYYYSYPWASSEIISMLGACIP